MKICFYNQKTCDSKLSREHLFSKVALEQAFGKPVKNIIGAEIYGKRKLIDQETVVKDVCVTCNSSLSPYDTAGQKLVLKLISEKMKVPLIIDFNRLTLGWLLKTHLNYIRVIKDREWNRSYSIKQEIKNAIIGQKDINPGKFVMLLDQWEEHEEFRDAECEKKFLSFIIEAYDSGSKKFSCPICVYAN